MAGSPAALSLMDHTVHICITFKVSDYDDQISCNLMHVFFIFFSLKFIWQNLDISWMCSIKFPGPMKFFMFIPWSFLPVLAWKIMEKKHGKFPRTGFLKLAAKYWANEFRHQTGHKIDKMYHCAVGSGCRTAEASCYNVINWNYWWKQKYFRT